MNFLIRRESLYLCRNSKYGRTGQQEGDERYRYFVISLCDSRPTHRRGSRDTFWVQRSRVRANGPFNGSRPHWGRALGIGCISVRFSASHFSLILRRQPQLLMGFDKADKRGSRSTNSRTTASLYNVFRPTFHLFPEPIPSFDRNRGSTTNGLPIGLERTYLVCACHDRYLIVTQSMLICLSFGKFDASVVVAGILV